MLACDVSLLGRDSDCRRPGGIIRHGRCGIGRIVGCRKGSAYGEFSVTGARIAVIFLKGYALVAVHAYNVAGLPEGRISVTVLFSEADFGLGERGAENDSRCLLTGDDFRNILLLSAGNQKNEKSCNPKYLLHGCHF